MAELNMRRSSQLARLLLAYDRIHRPMIAEDAAAAAHINVRSNYWKRCSDLRRVGGYLEIVGVAKSSMGAECNLYQITQAGKDKLKELGFRG